MNIKNLIVLPTLLFGNPAMGMWAGQAIAELNRIYIDKQLEEGKRIRQQRADTEDNISDPQVQLRLEEPASESCWDKCLNSCNHCWSRCVSIFCCTRNRNRRPSEETLMPPQTD